MNTIKESAMDTKLFNGVDVCVETSLHEYGLLASNNTNKFNEYTVIYGVDVDDDCTFTSFDIVYLSMDDIVLNLGEDWFDLKGFLSFIDESGEDFLKGSFANIVHSLFQYENYQNFVGCTYHSLDSEKIYNFINKHEK